jgi:phosphatidylglycerophosphatase A
VSKAVPPRRSAVARAVATAAGVGYSPWAPGTCGAALAVAITAVTAGLPLWAFLLLALATSAIGTWAAEAADRYWQTHDCQRIVIDEVAGTFVTMAFADRGDAAMLLLGFVLFRAFDILKPPPVRNLERALPNGLGVILDDVAAGLLAGAVLLALAQTSIPAHMRDIL